MTRALVLLVALCACSSGSGDSDAGDAARRGFVYFVDGGWQLEDAAQLEGDGGVLEDLEDAAPLEGDGGVLEDATQLEGDGGVLEDAAQLEGGVLEDAAQLEDAAPPTVNACGGLLALDHEPGSFCPGLVGTCATGRNCAIAAEWTCIGADYVACQCCEL